MRSFKLRKNDASIALSVHPKIERRAAFWSYPTDCLVWKINHEIDHVVAGSTTILTGPELAETVMKLIADCNVRLAVTTTFGNHPP